VSCGDYDRDGLVDIAFPAADIVWRNEGGVSFVSANPEVVSVSCPPRWGDYDLDGRLDLVLCGTTGSMHFPDYVSTIYRNQGGYFADIAPGLRPLDWGDLAWGDCDSDGDPDLVVTGNEEWNSGKRYSVVYRNRGGQFVEMGLGLVGLKYSCVALGDFDDDGDLDMVLAGNSEQGDCAHILRNECTAHNSPPEAPHGLHGSVVGSEATLSWSAPYDSRTPSQGLSYEVRIGTAPGTVDAVAPPADPVTGWRRIPARGPIQTTTWRVTLPAGMYYWSVQAVDAAFAGSAWAAEATVVVP
jgi:hypothetical protein